ncbi:hypothetical protein CSOJ01_11263 [Colletotrichum sojae]|uniref:Cell wall protein n=1 Tax=Colletotrichum sojae TaxID=2175907 RepID=A0A8H6MNY6_9PEZI|nr:hypothetical protein CSOJ01_11263 [Colletotrichum sojae]
MKFSAPAALLFAAGALASPTAAELCARELSTVNTIMTTVLEGIQGLDSSISAYKGGPGKELEEASTKMLGTIRTATNNAAAMTPLTMDEAIAFQPLSDKLNAAGDKLLTDLESKVDLFAKSKICETTLSWVAQVGGNVNTLMTTISTKFPAGGKGGDEIAHFNKIFQTMQDKLAACSGGGSGVAPTAASNGTKPDATGKPSSGSGSKPSANPTNKDESNPSKPTSAVKPVVTAGAAIMTVSGAGLFAAFAALLL